MTLTLSNAHVDNRRMTSMAQLEALDAAERRRLHDVAIRDTRRAIEERRADHAVTEHLERFLAKLLAAEPVTTSGTPAR